MAQGAHFVVEPEIAEPRYSLIIPAHNEARRIGRTLAGYLDAFADSEVLLVLNGCTDDTEGVARQAARSHTNLRILRIEHAVGKGGAVRAGFLAAKAAVVGYVDADGATPPEEMRRLFDSLRRGEDAIIASRWSKGAQVVVAQPILRRLSSRVFNTIVRVLFGLPFHDTQCGAKVFTSESIRLISSSLEISNFAFDIDLLYSMRRAGLRVREEPTRWHDIDGSRIDLPRASLQMLYAVLRLRLRHSLFRYVIPLFDRVWPTTTLCVRHGLSVLVIDLHDPCSPLAGPSERYMHDVGASLVRDGHRVHWLSAGFVDAPAHDVVSGIQIKRVGKGVGARFAIPATYVRSLRDRFDVIVEVQHGVPFLSPLFSFKPKICLTVQPANAPSRFTTMLASIVESVRRRLLRTFYGSSRFIAVSNEHERYLNELGIEATRIETALERAFEHSEIVGTRELAVESFLEAIYTEVSRNHLSYVLSGKEWTIVPYRARQLTLPRAANEGRSARTLL